MKTKVTNKSYADVMAMPRVKHQKPIKANMFFRTLMKIASIFDVSMDYLLCVSDIRHPYAVSEETMALHKFHQYYTQLNEESKKELLVYMRYLIYNQEDAPAKDKTYGEQEVKPVLLKAAQKSEEYK